MIFENSLISFLFSLFCKQSTSSFSLKQFIDPLSGLLKMYTDDKDKRPSLLTKIGNQVMLRTYNASPKMTKYGT